MPCKECGGPIKPNAEKLKTVAVGTAAVATAGFLIGTPTGWLALLAGAASPEVMKVARLKLQAAHKSNQAGSYFECARCGRDVGVGEALGF